MHGAEAEESNASMTDWKQSQCVDKVDGKGEVAQGLCHALVMYRDGAFARGLCKEMSAGKDQDFNSHDLWAISKVLAQQTAVEHFLRAQSMKCKISAEL